MVNVANPSVAFPYWISYHFRTREAVFALLPVHRRHTATPTCKSLGLSPALSKELKSLFQSPITTSWDSQCT